MSKDMKEVLVTVSSDNKDLFGSPIINSGGQFALDENGKARVNLAVASECYKHPAFSIPNDQETAIVKEFLASTIETESGRYDVGEIVRVECAELAGSGIAVSDGQTVIFTPDGFAACGLNTALALQKVVPSLQIEMPKVEAPKVEMPRVEAPQAVDADKEKAESGESGTENDETETGKDEDEAGESAAASQPSASRAARRRR